MNVYRCFKCRKICAPTDICGDCALKGVDRWVKLSDRLPEEGVVVDVMKSDGEITQLKRRGRLWFVPDGIMYVYYEPTFWRERV